VLKASIQVCGIADLGALMAIAMFYGHKSR
jgi:hypothetical protein